MKKIFIVFIILIEIISAQDYFYYKKNHKIELIPQQVQENKQFFYYKTKEGRLLGISDKILVKSNNKTLLKKYLTEYNLTLLKTLSDQLYLIKVSNKNMTLDIANELNEKEGILYAHPDFRKPRILR